MQAQRGEIEFVEMAGWGGSCAWQGRAPKWQALHAPVQAAAVRQHLKAELPMGGTALHLAAEFRDDGDVAEVLLEHCEAEHLLAAWGRRTPLVHAVVRHHGSFAAAILRAAQRLSPALAHQLVHGGEQCDGALPAAILCRDMEALAALSSTGLAALNGECHGYGSDGFSSLSLACRVSACSSASGLA